MRTYLMGLPILAFLLAGCAGTQTPTATTTAPAARSGGGVNEFQLETPATWSGEIPCADCPAIRMTLTLRPDGVFLLRQTYVGAAEGRDRSFVDRGRWTTGENGRRLVLRGGTEAPRRFAVLASGRLRMLDTEGNEIRSKLNYELARAAAVDPIADRSRMRGTFRYLADAARYADCLTGQDLPVATTAGYLPLERAYLAARPEPGAPLLVTLEGHVEMRAGMEGDALEETLVVDAFDRVWPGESCGPTIEGKTWRLLELPGQTLAATESARAPILMLDPTTRRVTGLDGCNRFNGSYELDGDRLRFRAIASTRMACLPEVMAAADAYLRILVGEVSWALHDGALILVRDGQMVARFAAGEPR